MIITGTMPNSILSTGVQINGIPLDGRKNAQKQIFKINGEKYGKIELSEREQPRAIELINNIKNKTLDNKNVNGFFTSTQEYQLHFVTTGCPTDFTSELLYYRKSLGNGQDCLFPKIEYQVLLAGNLVGIMRQYLMAPTGTNNVSYSYDALNWNGINYYIYPVVANRKDYYCIYKGNDLVAIIETARFASVFKNYCTIYASDDLDKDFLCIVAGIICNNDELKLPLYQSTLNDSKFDSKFIERIKGNN